MLIGKPEPVVFDFENRWQESLAVLDDEILFSSGRSGYPITEPDGKLLIGLLHRQFIRVHAQKYSLSYEATPEEHNEVRHYAMMVGKKRYTGSVAHALRVYRNHKPLDHGNKYNALYYPSLKAYVRFGDLYPAKLLAMLEEEQCNGVTLFRDCADSNTEDRFFILTLGISKSDYLALMAREREQRAEEMIQAVITCNANSNIAFPKVYETGE